MPAASERPRGASRAGWGGAERPPEGEEPGQSPESGGLSAKAHPRKRPSAPPREMARRGGGRLLSASRPRWRHYARPRQNTRPAPPLYNASAITQRRRHCARLAPKCKAGARTRGRCRAPAAVAAHPRLLPLPGPPQRGREGAAPGGHLGSAAWGGSQIRVFISFG